MRRARIFWPAALIGLAAASWGASCPGAELLPDGRLGVRTAPLLLLSRGDVQADLAMSREQVADAGQAISALYGKAQALRGKTGEEAIAARRAIDEEQQRWLEGKLSEEQRNRLVQIDLQWEGASALVRPALAELLGISPEQLATLKQAVADAQARRGRGEPAIGVEHQLARHALEVLSESQRARWKAILGRPFVPRLAEARSTPR